MDAAMRLSLLRHPDAPCAAVTRIDVEAARPRPNALALSYVVEGDVAGLRLPAAAPPARADELWKHTCFEAFVRPGDGEAYYELNFATSTQWAAYRFSGYRAGMAAASEIAAPRIDLRAEAGRLQLSVIAELPESLRDAPWRLAVSAVIEEANGAKSYWALAHAPGRPDFHDSDSFACELPALERP
jgi:hypothetical protein